MKILKKIIIVLFLLYASSIYVFADTMRDLEIASEMLEIAEYGAKASWTADELENLEKLASEFTDNGLAQIWTANIVLYSLTSQSPQCDIAKENISRLSDENLKSIWEQNYNLYGC